MVFVKKIRSGSKTYFYLVRSKRIGNTVHQETIMSLTSEEANDPDFLSEFLFKNPQYQKSGIKAIIPAAGKSLRLFPYSEDLPKGLVPIKTKPILHYIIDSLNECGVNDIIIITGFQGKKFEKSFFGAAKFLYNPFYTISGVLPSLWLAYHEIDTPLLILYSDLLFEKTIIKDLLQDETDICIAISTPQNDGVTEKVITEDGYAIEIGTKVPMNIKRMDFAGIAKFSSKGASLLQKTLDEMAREDGFLHYTLSDALERLILKGEKIAVKTIPTDLWIDINTPQDLQRAEREIITNIFSKNQTNDV